MIRNKIKIIIVLFMLIIAACSKDKTPQQEKNLLLGKWKPITELDTDGETFIYESSCNNVWTFTENSLTADWDDDCNGSIDESNSANYTLENDRFNFGIDTEGEQLFLKNVSQTTLEINFVDISILDEPYGYLMTFERIN